jgi:hypothetical protein
MARVPVDTEKILTGHKMLTGIRTHYVLQGASLDTRPTFSVSAVGTLTDKAGAPVVISTTEKGGK